MEIQNIRPQSFTGIHCVNPDKMSGTQKILCRMMKNMILQNKTYQKADKAGVDILILSGRNKKSVLVRFLDRLSEDFYKKDGKIVQTGFSTDADDLLPEQLLNQLKGIINGDIKEPVYNPYKILNGKTDARKTLREDYKHWASGTEYKRNYWNWG